MSLAKWNLRVMILHVLLFATASSMFRVMFPYYLSDMGLSLKIIGLATSLGSAAAVLALPFTGFVSDSIGRKPVIFLAAIMVFLASLTAISGSRVPQAILGQMFFMIAFNIGAPARNALLADSVSLREAGRTFGIVATFFSLSRVLSPYPAGLVAERYGYHALFTIDALLAFMAGIIAFSLLRETLNRRRDRSFHRLFDNLKETIVPSRREAPLLSFLVMDRFSWALWIPLLSPYLRTAYGLSPSMVGLMFTLIDLVGIFTQYGMGKLSDRYGGFYSMVFSEAAGLIVVLSFAIHPPRNFLWILMGLLGLSFSSWIPGYNAFLSRVMRSREARGRFFAKTNFYRGIAHPPASALGGVLFDNVGLSAPFLSSSLMLSITLVFLWVYLRGLEKEGLPSEGYFT